MNNTKNQESEAIFGSVNADSLTTGNTKFTSNINNSKKYQSNLEVCDSTKDRESKSTNGRESLGDSEEYQEATSACPSVNEHRIDSVNVDFSKANTDIEQSNESSYVQTSGDKGCIDKSKKKNFSHEFDHLDRPPICKPPVIYIEPDSNIGLDDNQSQLQSYFMTGNDVNTVLSEENHIVSCLPTLSLTETSTQGQPEQCSSDSETQMIANVTMMIKVIQKAVVLCSTRK